jgi:DNA (cytosine-5)-methyltransferase 1
MNYIDIFAGCGGLSLGLYNAGWQGLFAIEKNPMAFATLKHNLIDKREHFQWPDWLEKKNHDINTILVEKRTNLQALEGKVDLVAGGPPCQGFSYAGKRDEQDHRNQLINSYIEFVKLVKPRMVFFENVRGFTSKFIRKPTEGKIYSDIVTARLMELDYDVKPKILDFSNYGIPQRRKRFILFGIQNGDAKSFFERIDNNKRAFLKKKKLPYKVTAREALSDLERCHGEINSLDSKNFMAGVYGDPDNAYQKFMRKLNQNPYPDSHRFVNHKNKTIEKFKYFIETSPKNKNLPSAKRKDLNLRKNCITLLDPNQPSPTLTTLTDDYIHYCEPRVLTVREFARLQSFDDWFEFREKYTTGGKSRVSEVPRYTQVGNAIPPLFVEQAGQIMKAMV